MSSNSNRNSTIGTVIFVAGMLAAALLFVTLGFWQMERLGWKEQLIASATERANDLPTNVPSADLWATLDPESIDFQPVTLKGSFLEHGEARIFISLPQKRNRHSGPGYWIVTPFQLADAGIVYVNRGFVPQELAFNAGYAAAPIGQMTITGVLRKPERVGAATLEPDLAKNVDWVINPARLSTVLFGDLGTVAPFYINWQPAEEVKLPQPAQTGEIEFSNKHLEYALTWFALAAMTPVLLIFWLLRRKRNQSLATEQSAD
ncbi:SURF1 family protein [Maritalea porphyrae]|uniref:SURF1 family protein n=1 Tax=Maritalea porphyrae TaxID=880732 RepID=UPI0022AE7186|nr:SURF1 family protein [Maritalea porphyrae]MCZ4271401.1 SURF1 family protein [Maritalea porphyrae]